MDNVLINVENLEAVEAFFAELGIELEGRTTVEGPWAGKVIGLENVRADITMMRTPDGHGRVELSKFHTPPAVRAEPEDAPANALGIRRIMFAVENLDDIVERLRSHGADPSRRDRAVREPVPTLLRAWSRGDPRRTRRGTSVRQRVSRTGAVARAALAEFL
jgi:Glyoxalase/Bleomycin resistance protein/Dioxygenase superfamily